MAKFFISYSRSVKDEVRKVVDLLIASRHEVWWDGDIPVIADWWATILEKIEWCEVFIFVASEKSVQSAYCLAELKYASDRQRPILPFMLEDPSSLKLPKELPSRGQWLLYDGDPAQMLSQINTACEKINWALHKDIKVRRPPEPSVDGISVAKQFQLARRLASEKQFEDAKLAFTNIKHLDYTEWGAECDEWLGRLNSYIPIMELVDDESTLTRARTEWAIHSRRYGKEFDPHGIDQKLRRMPPTKHDSPWLALLGLVLGVIAVSVFLSQLNQNPRSEFTPSPTNAVAQINIETPTLSGFQQLQTTEAELTQSAGTQAALELTLTEQFISDSNATATAQMFAVTETAAYATLLALSATPTPSLTHTPDLAFELTLTEQFISNNATAKAEMAAITETVAYVTQRALLATPTMRSIDVRTPRLDITLRPTPRNAQVEVLDVIGRGDIASEKVKIFNKGSAVVDLTGWTLRDLDGNEYVFSEIRLFSEGIIEISTRQGTDTAVTKFWGLNSAIWGEQDDVVILSDHQDIVQSILRFSPDE